MSFGGKVEISFAIFFYERPYYQTHISISEENNFLCTKNVPNVVFDGVFQLLIKAIKFPADSNAST